MIKSVYLTPNSSRQLNQKGFTLLEIILAISILASIGILTINILSSQIATRQKISYLNNDQHSIHAALSRLTRDLEGAYIGDSKYNSSLNLLGRNITPQFIYKNNNLIFFTMANRSYNYGSNESNQAFVRYFIQPNPTDSTKNQLVRAVDTDMVDNIERDDIGVSEILIDNVESFTVEFWDGNQYQKEWNSQANDTQNKIPKMVKIHLSIFASTAPKQFKDSTNKSDKVKYTLDTIVYLLNAQGRKEANTPAWSEFKWN